MSETPFARLIEKSRALKIGCSVAAAFQTHVLLAENAPPSPPPDQWNYITDSPELTTSRCIGIPKTPLCAMETLLACFQRDEFQLCRMVDDKAEEYANAFASPSPHGRYLAYRLVRSMRFSAPAPAEDPVIQAGDVMLLIDQRDGALGLPAPPTGAPDQKFVLRQGADKRWRVVNWGGPGD